MTVTVDGRTHVDFGDLAEQGWLGPPIHATATTVESPTDVPRPDTAAPTHQPGTGQS